MGNSDYEIIDRGEDASVQGGARRVIQVDADVAVMQFNYVEGHVYWSEELNVYNVPAGTFPQTQAADCWQLSFADWDAGKRPIDLQNDGQAPVPVWASSLGQPVGWLEDFAVQAPVKKLKHA